MQSSKQQIPYIEGSKEHQFVLLSVFSCLSNLLGQHHLMVHASVSCRACFLDPDTHGLYNTLAAISRPPALDCVPESEWCTSHLDMTRWACIHLCVP